MLAILDFGPTNDTNCHENEVGVSAAVLGAYDGALIDRWEFFDLQRAGT